MCEILVRAFDSRMPTVEEWRARMSIAVTEANAFMAAHSEMPRIEANLIRIERYQAAKGSMRAVQKRERKSGKAQLKPAEREALLAEISSYEAAPLSEKDISELRTALEEVRRPDTSVIPSLLDFYRYHKSVLEVDSIKTDEEKRVELATADRRGCYKRGDPVGVFEDGHEWGREEGPPRFIVLRFIGMTAEEAVKYTEPEVEVITDRARLRPGESSRTERLTRRRYSIDLAGLESGATLTRAEFLSRLTDKAK